MQEEIKLLQSLVQIDSQNPPGDERKIVSFISRYLKGLSAIEKKVYLYKKNRPNLVCFFGAAKPKYTVLITPHLDTVPLGTRWHYPPLGGVIKRGRLYGRGATDCKANVAVSLCVLKELACRQYSFSKVRFIFAFYADEETGSDWGINPLLDDLGKIDFGIVLDADEFDLIVAQKGLLHLRLDFFGKASHGAYPERGINAAAALVFTLNKILSKKFSFSFHSLLLKPTINLGRIYGGEKVNIVADYAYAELDIRYLPSQKKAQIIKELRQICLKYSSNFKIKVMNHQLPVEIAPNSPLIAILKETLDSYKIPFKKKASFGATVLSFLQRRKIKSFAFGFGTKCQAHTADEYVSLNNIIQGKKVFKDYLIALEEKL